MDTLAEIKKLYFSTTVATIDSDFDRAIDLLKSMASEEERGRAAVFMEGLAEMKKNWDGASRTQNERRTRNKTPRGS